MDITVIIPVYNGEKTIIELFRRLKDELGKYFTYEIIFIHDSGKDNSWGIITDLIKTSKGEAKGFRLSQNYGQHNAILFGITMASGDFIITLDEDLQHDPSYIRELSEKQKEGSYDVVYARFMKLKHPDFRISTSELLRAILSRIVPGLYEGYSPYRFIKRDVAQKLIGLKNSYTFIDGYLGMVTDNFGFINAEHYKRADGTSSYSYNKLFRHAIMIAIAYSPLKKWILFSALFLNLISIIGYIISGLIIDSSSLELVSITSGISGIIFLFCGLVAEAIHYHGIKTNKMPVVL
jgi:polyisoprenyl-phosphate glycosyltransferase